MRLIGVDPEATEGPRTLIGIGAVRDIIHTAYLRPYEGRKRVFIITEADLLSADAANALLKILEEPPPDVVLILLSNNAEGVLPTVRSRCQTLEFRPLPIEAVARVLREEEGLGEEQAQVLARLSRGCIGWAIGAGRDDALYAGVHQRLEHAVDAIEESWTRGSPMRRSWRGASSETAAPGERICTCCSGGCATCCSFSRGWANSS